MIYVASAPGKLVLLGEYVVLEGAPALVAAMDARAEARFEVHKGPEWHVVAENLGVQTCYVQGADGLLTAAVPVPPSLRFVEAVLRHILALDKAQLPYGRLTLNTDAFYLGQQKLGLGSSAAISCACWQALHAAAFPMPTAKEMAPVGDRRRAGPLHDLHALHHKVQGGAGSGVDIAASLWGGIIRFQRQNKAATAQISPLQALQNIVLLPVWSGESQATAPMLAAFHSLKERRPDVFWQNCETLAVLANAGAEFWALGHVSAFLTVIDQVDAALTSLGEAMGMPIVTPAHRAIGEVVRRAGGAYKPSGAGGGDLGIAVCPTRQIAGRVQARLKAQSIMPIALPLAAQGLTFERRDS